MTMMKVKASTLAAVRAVFIREEKITLRAFTANSNTEISQQIYIKGKHTTQH